MEKCMIFPLNDDTEIVVRNTHSDYQINVLSSYYEDKRKLEKFQKTTSTFCSTDFDACLECVDAVIFAENTMGRSNRGYKERIEKVLSQEKTVYIEKKFFEKLNIPEVTGKICFIGEDAIPQIKKGRKLREIQVPIISVMGMGENSGKFEMLNTIHQYVKKQGYTPLTVCSNPLGKFVGMETLPEFLLSEDLSFQRKIEAFNEWLYQKQDEEEIDLILLGYPGGILPFNELETNFYSEIPLILSNAVISDVGFLTVYKSFNRDKKAMDSFRKLCQIKYNVLVNDFVISENYYRTNYEEGVIRFHRDNLDIFSKSNYTEIEDCSFVSIEDEQMLRKRIGIVLSMLEGNFFFI